MSSLTTVSRLPSSLDHLNSFLTGVSTFLLQSMLPSLEESSQMPLLQYVSPSLLILQCSPTILGIKNNIFNVAFQILLTSQLFEAINLHLPLTFHFSSVCSSSSQEPAPMLSSLTCSHGLPAVRASHMQVPLPLTPGCYPRLPA